MFQLRKPTTAPPAPTATATPQTAPSAVAPKEAPQMHASELAVDSLAVLDADGLRATAAALQATIGRVSDDVEDYQEQAKAAYGRDDGAAVVAALAGKRAALDRVAPHQAQHEQAIAALRDRAQPLMDQAGHAAAAAMEAGRQRQRTIETGLADAIVAVERFTEELRAMPAELAAVARRHQVRFDEIAEMANPAGLSRPAVDFGPGAAATPGLAQRLLHLAANVDPVLGHRLSQLWP